jgi:hypothetical protein
LVLKKLVSEQPNAKESFGCSPMIALLLAATTRLDAGSTREVKPGAETSRP